LDPGECAVSVLEVLGYEMLFFFVLVVFRSETTKERFVITPLMLTQG
jgi:hypothetical protein